MAANSQYQKEVNGYLILQELRKENCSRHVLAEHLGIQPSTITYSVGRLMDAGLVETFGPAASSQEKTGRKQELIGLKKNAGKVFGIDLLFDHYRAVIMDLSGKVLEQEEESFDFDALHVIKGTAESFQAITAFVLDRLEGFHTDIPVKGACIAIAGIIDKNGRTIKASWTQGLHDFDASALIQKRSYPVFFENDANCTAMKYLSERNDSFVYTLVRQYDKHRIPSGIPTIGIGMGIVLDGKLYRGYSSRAGEFNSVYYHEGENTMRQLSLSNETLADFDNNGGSLRAFMVEFASNIFFISSMLNPRTIYLGGELEKWNEVLRNVLETEYCGKLQSMQEEGVSFTFLHNTRFDAAFGSCCLLLDYLFHIPSPSNNNSGWNDRPSPLLGDV